MPSLRSFAATVAAAAAVVSLATAASAADVCIPSSITDALSACAGLPALAPGAKRSGLAAPAVAPPPAPKAAGTSPPPLDPKLSAADIRRATASPRSLELLTKELQSLESLIAATSPGSGDRPKLLRRLADGYVELEAAQIRRKTMLRIEGDALRKKDPAQAKQKLEEAGKAERIEGAARQAAIKHYQALRQRHPGFCQSPGAASAQASGCLDEVLYDLAYEHEQAGDAAEARKVYLDLVQSAPSSRYVPSAYLAFGELFFQEAQGDPSKWPLAEQAYLQVLKYPPPDNKVFAYASYKLGYVYWNKGDFPQAIHALKRTIEAGTKSPAGSGAELAASARKDLVPLFALAGDPKKAFDFFHPLSGDASGDTARTFGMMADLGQGYLDVGHYKEAIELYQDLQRRDRGPRSCEYQAHVTEAVLAMKTGDKAAAKAELDRQLQLAQRFEAEDRTDAQKLACANLTASLALETAMIWHLEAVGSGSVRGTLSNETMGFAADLYQKVLKQFDASRFAGFSFPRLVKEDWPTRLKVAMSRADLLYAEHDWDGCGSAFDAVVDEEPRGPLAAEAAYASALCYQHAYLAAHQGHSDRAGLGSGAAPSVAARELGPREKAMLRSFDRFLCVAKPDASDKQAFETYTEVEFARARVYFDAHRWAEAAASFRALAVARPYHEAGVFAAELYLEALNVMATHGSPACIDDMDRDLPAIAELQCGGDKKKANAEGCASIARTERDVVRLAIQKDAQKLQGPGHEKEWETVAERYLKLWNASGKEPCEAKQAGCDGMDEVLTNAARAFSAARLLAKAIAVRKILIDPRYGMDARPLARHALREIGQNYQAIAVYDESATFYERFAQASPTAAEAAEALEDAIVLRLGLGQEEKALEDADLFRRSYEAQHPALSAQIAFAIGAHEADHDDLAKARKRLSSAMGEIDRGATVDVQIQAHAVLGRVLSRTGSETAAASEYAKVRSLYRDPAAVAAKLAGGEEAEAQKRLSRVLTAVGEALFFEAAQKQKAVDAIRFPEYRGSGRRDDVLRHVNTKVMEWVAKKKPAIEEVEKQYHRILELRPSPPPRWVIASGERVGHLWGKFVAEFRAAPIPKEWKQNGPSPYGDLTWEEIRAAYYEALDLASEPYKKRAKGAYQGCLEESSRYQHFDERSRACEGWLSKNYGGEFHRLDELRGAPFRVGMRIDGTPAALAP